MKKLVVRTLGIVLLSFILGMYCLLVFYYIKGPIIKLNGNHNYSTNIYDSYNDPGYKAFYLYNDMTDEVDITSNVDISEFGNYTIDYYLNYDNKIYSIKRNVKVIDKEAPTIILNEDSYACPNKEFIETGYEVIDNYDDNLKDRVEVIKSDDKWIYSVTDNSGNKTSIERNIIHEDVVKPTIELIKPEYSIYINSYYQDPGYKIADNCDDDLSNNITISGNVDTSTIGKYTITYKVSDSSGNETEASRTVNVVNKPIFVNNAIYLTFDDGPSANITPQILDILKEEGVQATFFINDHGRGLDYLIKRAVAEGHMVASHTASHDFYSVYTSEAKFFSEIDYVHDLIYNLTGLRTKIFRFPGGSSNTISRYNPGIMSRLVKQADNNGYLYYDWTIDSNDAGGANTKEAVYNNVTRYMGKYSLNIVLMHDSGNKYATLAALRDIIRYGKQMGFNFLPITETTPQSRHGVNN